MLPLGTRNMAYPLDYLSEFTVKADGSQFLHLLPLFFSFTEKLVYLGILLCYGVWFCSVTNNG